MKTAQILWAAITDAVTVQLIATIGTVGTVVVTWLTQRKWRHTRRRIQWRHVRIVIDLATALALMLLAKRIGVATMAIAVQGVLLCEVLFAVRSFGRYTHEMREDRLANQALVRQIQYWRDEHRSSDPPQPLVPEARSA